ncbi:MAG: hypothetical protein IKU17_10810, partial [Clostridia bacterium]|nr:hypothetical protein [Clostridia bacterium]
EESTIKIPYHVILPNGVMHDITVKIYRNGELTETRVVNPALNNVLEFAYEGSKGTDKIVVTLDGQEHLHIDFNYEDASAVVTAEYPYVDESASSEVTSNPESSEETSSEDSSENPASSEETSEETSSVEAAG